MAILDEGSLDTPEGTKVTKALKQELLKPDTQGFTLANVMGLSDEEVASTYATACQRLAQNDLGGAGKLFMTLIALRHSEGKHWRGMGVVAQRANAHAQAEFLYSMALKHKPGDVISLVFRAEARVNLHRQGAARQDLLEAIEIGERNQRDDQTYVKRARKLLQMLDASDSGGTFERG